MGMPEYAKKLHKETNNDLIDDEVEAVEGYERAIDESDNPEAIATYEHIKGEEEEHIDELRDLDKMKTEDITSEQAWQDFKAGYSDFEEKHIGKDREGDKASLEEKMDVISAKLSEISTDMSRLTDSVPQALGTIEEEKTLEQEAEEEGDALGEEGGFDDGLDDFFADEGGDDAVGGEGGIGGDGEQPVDEDGNPIEDSDESAEEDGDMEAEELPDEEVGESEGESDDDFISMDEIMSDDESEDGETSDEEVEEVEDEVSEEKDDEETLDKMVRVLEKMDRRITQLERENIGLKKQLSDMSKVQTERRNVAKSRPTPNTNLKMVKGSYNRPPVSTQYVANQRDIGIGKKTESSNTSVFRQGLNEVFEECTRIATQTH